MTRSPDGPIPSTHTSPAHLRICQNRDEDWYLAKSWVAQGETPTIARAGVLTVYEAWILMTAKIVPSTGAAAR